MPIFGMHFVLWKLVMIIGYITLRSLLVYAKLVVAIARLWSWRKEVGWLYTIIKHAWFLILYIVSLLPTYYISYPSPTLKCITTYLSSRDLVFRCQLGSECTYGIISWNLIVFIKFKKEIQLFYLYSEITLFLTVQPNFLLLCYY